jgi:NAD(P)H-dependent FMN reductase
MNTILFIEVSPRGKESASRAVADTLAARLSALYPSAKLVRHDLAADHPPHLDDITLRAISTKDADEAERLNEVARRSDQLTNELLDADLLVIATPMWNFGIPSTSKRGSTWWFDRDELFNMPMAASSVWPRTRRPFWCLLRGASLRKDRGVHGILSNLTCVRSWVLLVSLISGPFEPKE